MSKFEDIGIEISFILIQYFSDFYSRSGLRIAVPSGERKSAILKGQTCLILQRDWIQHARLTADHSIRRPSTVCQTIPLAPALITAEMVIITRKIPIGTWIIKRAHLLRGTRPSIVTCQESVGHTRANKPHLYCVITRCLACH